jgi:large subunit ribosomal protein L18
MAGHIKIVNPKVRKRLRRKKSIRKRVHGTAERPRLSVFRSLKHIYAQAIDDTTNRVVASISDLHKEIETEGKKKKKERARAVGVSIGKKLLDMKIEQVVFDRNGFIYHGRIKEVADGAREAGLKF